MLSLLVDLTHGWKDGQMQCGEVLPILQDFGPYQHWPPAFTKRIYANNSCKIFLGQRFLVPHLFFGQRLCFFVSLSPLTSRPFGWAPDPQTDLRPSG